MNKETGTFPFPLKGASWILDEAVFQNNILEKLKNMTQGGVRGCRSIRLFAQYMN